MSRPPLPQFSDESFDVIADRGDRSRFLSWLELQNWIAAVSLGIPVPPEVVARALRCEE